MRVLPDLLRFDRFAETRPVLILACSLLPPPSMISPRHLRNLVVCHLPVRPIGHHSQLATIDEERLTSSISEFVVLLVPRQKPKTDGNLSRIEKLPRKGDDAVHEIRFNQAFPDLPLP